MNAKQIRIAILFLFLNHLNLSSQESAGQIPNHSNLNEIKKWAENFYNTEEKKSMRSYGYKHYAKWEDQIAPYTLKNGEIVNPTSHTLKELLKYQEKYPDFNSGELKMLGAGANWTLLGPSTIVNEQPPGDSNRGPGPGIGRVCRVAFHPTDPDILFAGAPNGGLWVTTNGGNSWRSMMDGLPRLGVTGIAIHPQNPAVIYVLTGDGVFFNNQSIGVLKTTNGGDTWTLTDLDFTSTGMDKAGVEGYDMVMDPNNPDVMFAATSDGLYKTTDGWETAQRVISSVVIDVKLKPAAGAASTVYAMGRNGATSGTDLTFLRSLQLGAIGTWENEDFHNIGNGLPADLNAGASRAVLSVSAASPNNVYILYGNTSIGGDPTKSLIGLFVSTNSGVNFSDANDGTCSKVELLEGELPGGFNSGYGNQANSNIVLEVSPTNGNNIHVGGINLWKSTDRGKCWNLSAFGFLNVNYEYVHADINDLEYNFDGTLYCCSDGGIYKSTDNGNTWTDITSGLAISEFIRFGGTPQNGDLLYMGATHNGIFRYTPAQISSVQTGDGSECLIDPSDENIVYTRTIVGDQMSRSDDGAQSFQNIKPANSGGSVLNTNPMVLHPQNTSTVFAGFNEVWRSTSKGSPGASWQQISSFNSDLINGSLISVSLCESSPNTIYVLRNIGAPNHQVWKTTNANANNPTWTNVTNNLPMATSGRMRYMIVSPDDANNVYVTYSSLDEGLKVYRSVNGGNSWFNYSSGLPNLPVNCIAFEKGSPFNGVYVGMDWGVFYRNDLTSEWIPFMTGLPASARPFEMEIHQGDGKIRAVSFGRGMWESSLFSSCATIYSLTDANNPYKSGVQRYQAADRITSSRSIIGKVSDVEYIAGNRIELKPGFKVLDAKIFKAIIDNDCDNAENLNTLALADNGNALRGIYIPTEKQHKTSSIKKTVPALSEKLNVYPNPSNKILYFNLDVTQKFTTIVLRNTAGEELFRQADLPSDHIYSINMDKYSAGIYILQMEVDGILLTKKISLIK